MEVVISGCVFSSLFYELTNTKGNAEGFLIGQITSRTSNTITDSQTENVKLERVATIQGFIPFGKIFSFYDYAGHINDRAVLEEFSDSEKTQKLIGWYKFRRNTPSFVSMRERVVHHNLIEELNFSPDKEFILAIFTASMNRDMSSHKFDYSFYCSTHRRSSFEPLQVQILNLGDTSHSEYQVNSQSSLATSSIFHEVIDSYRSDFVDKNGYIQMASSIHTMYITMMKKLQDLVEVVKASETGVSSLAEEVNIKGQEVARLRLQLASRNGQVDGNEKRPLQSFAVANHSSQRTECNEKSVMRNSSDTCVVSSGIKNKLVSDHIEREMTQDNTSNDRQDVFLNEHSKAETSSFSRSRKQMNPGKVVVCVSAEDDDDVTDDETQTYSLSNNFDGSGQEEENSATATIISSSPIF